MNKEQLIDFEKRVAEKFNNKEIRSPIHLYNGNEDIMIDLFKNIDIKNDWVCCTWRNHYQCLLKGVPEDVLMEKIISGKSMVMNLPEYKIVTSSIVGGIYSIATGIAYSIKRKGGSEKVWCWSGDMGAKTGAFHEAYEYSKYHELPITFIVEHNGLSVETPIDEVWNPDYLNGYDHLIEYEYHNKLYPHAGAGIRVTF